MKEFVQNFFNDEQSIIHDTKSDYKQPQQESDDQKEIVGFQSNQSQGNHENGMKKKCDANDKLASQNSPNKNLIAIVASLFLCPILVYVLPYLLRSENTLTMTNLLKNLTFDKQIFQKFADQKTQTLNNRILEMKENKKESHW